MSSKMKLSEEVTQELDYLSNKLSMRRNIICRMALGYSLGVDPAPELVSDSSGQEFNKSTIIGNDDQIITALLSVHFKKRIDPELMFSDYAKAEISRGIILLSKILHRVNSPVEFMMAISKYQEVDAFETSMEL